MNGYPNLFINDTIKKVEELKANPIENEKLKKIFYLQLVYRILEKFFKRLKG